MFRWYTEAVIYYVYLLDVPSSVNLANDESSQLTYKKNAWFTRGWTLQELLAPKDVHFYSSQWTKLGTKLGLSHLLSAASGIDQVYLLGDNIHTASIAKRMFWASKRKTTRKEDIVYWLLGIFDINIPLLYGEGEKAFVRLQEEIIKTSDNQIILAWGHNEGTWILGHERGRYRPEQKLRGLLAASPAEFAEAENFQPSHVWGVWDVNNRQTYKQLMRSFSIRNIGLHITFPVLHVHEENVLFAVLNCRSHDDDIMDSWIIPILEVLSERQFARRDSRRPQRKKTIIQESSLRSIYCRNKIIREVHIEPDWSGSFLLSNFPMTTQLDGDRLLDRKYGVIGGEPRSFWSKQLGIVGRHFSIQHLSRTSSRSS